MPPGAVYVGRPSRWGNPYVVRCSGNSAVVANRRKTINIMHGPKAIADAIVHAVWYYEYDLVYGRLPFSVSDVRRELRGKDLVCWCPLGQPCHADVLLDLANHCSHKFVDSNVCLKCGVHVRELRCATQKGAAL